MEKMVASKSNIRACEAHSSQMKSRSQVKHSESFSRDLGAMCKRNSIWLLFSLFLLTMFHIFIVPAADSHLSNILNQDQAPQDFSIPPSIDWKTNDKLLGGLLPAGLDEGSCQSRYQSNLYRRTQPRKPSSHLVKRLRNYEARQKECGPNTNPYKRTLENLKSSDENFNDSACKYVIWSPIRGLGNRMLTLAAAFLYALLTDRILLIGDAGNMRDLFCEPFPEVSWLLPSDFPIGQLSSFSKSSPNSYGNMLKNDSTGNSRVPPFLYVYLADDYDTTDKLFFCEQDQTFLQHVPWLIMKSDLYFVPSLFLIPSFKQELNNLFPERDTVFHHLGRYLFHPANSVWGLITRYYEAYLAKADETLGIQIRVYPRDGRRKTPSLDQILACTMNENLLPEVNKTEPIIKTPTKPKTKAVLITSLTANHYEEIREMYWQHATITGEVISVHQPSHEERQRFRNQMHDRKALTDLYLLSFTDKLMTSGWSTFGYAAQSLGGMQPWILDMPLGDDVPNPPCQLASSMEPCFHFAPAIDSCRNRQGIETANLVSHVRHCEDWVWGLKLFNKNN